MAGSHEIIIHISLDEHDRVQVEAARVYEIARLRGKIVNLEGLLGALENAATPGQVWTLFDSWTAAKKLLQQYQKLFRKKFGC